MTDREKEELDIFAESLLKPMAVDPWDRFQEVKPVKTEGGPPPCPRCGYCEGSDK